MQDRSRENQKSNDTSTEGSFRSDRRRVLGMTAGSMATAATAGCMDIASTITGSDGTTEPLRVGVLAPRPDGDFVGQSMARAAEIAVKVLRAEGNDIEIVVADTNESPMEVKRQYHRLVLEEDVDATVGIFSEVGLEYLMDEIAEQERIHLTSGAATTTASRRVANEYSRYKYHFRVGPANTVDLGRAQIDFVADMADNGAVDWDSIGLLAEDLEWSEEPWEVYQERLDEVDVDVPFERKYPAGTDDFSEIYTEIEDSGADVALTTIGFTGTDAVPEWHDSNYSFEFGGLHVPMQLPTYYDEVDGRCEYGFTYNSAPARGEITAETERFLREYYDEFDGEEPVYAGFHTYDAITMFAAAVERAGTRDADELVQELENMTFSGTVGPIQFYERDHEFAHDVIYGDDGAQTVYLQWQENDAGDGVQEVIWPEQYQTAEYARPDWV